MCKPEGHEEPPNTFPNMEDDGAVSSPQDSGVLDAETEATPAVVDEEEPQADDIGNDNDDTAAADNGDDDDERAARRRRGREEQEEEEEEEGVLKDPPYEYPTGLIEVDDQ